MQRGSNNQTSQPSGNNTANQSNSRNGPQVNQGMRNFSLKINAINLF